MQKIIKHTNMASAVRRQIISCRPSKIGGGGTHKLAAAPRQQC